jgi:hypothetical protein
MTDRPELDVLGYFDRMAKRAGRLIADLQQARKVYDKDSQAGSTAALEAAIVYLEDQNYDFRLLLPLQSLHDALCDANRGAKNPILSVAKGGGGRRKPLTSERWEPFAAATVTILRKAGDDQKTALRSVSRAMGGFLSQKRLKYLRDRLSRASGTNAKMKQYYLEILSSWSADIPPIHRVRAEEMLEKLREVFLDYDPDNSR